MASTSIDLDEHLEFFSLFPPSIVVPFSTRIKTDWCAAVRPFDEIETQKIRQNRLKNPATWTWMEKDRLIFHSYGDPATHPTPSAPKRALCRHFHTLESPQKTDVPVLHPPPTMQSWKFLTGSKAKKTTITNLEKSKGIQETMETLFQWFSKSRCCSLV